MPNNSNQVTAWICASVFLAKFCACRYTFYLRNCGEGHTSIALTMAPPHVPATSDGSAQQPASKQSQDSKKSGKKSEGPFKRKRTGCVTCRSRKIRCDERKPDCLNCEKSKRECVWEEGSIWKHDQNPSVPNRRETKFYRTAPNEFAREDERRLNTAAPRSECESRSKYKRCQSLTKPCRPIREQFWQSCLCNISANTGSKCTLDGDATR